MRLGCSVEPFFCQGQVYPSIIMEVGKCDVSKISFLSFRGNFQIFPIIIESIVFDCPVYEEESFHKLFI